MTTLRVLMAPLLGLAGLALLDAGGALATEGLGYSPVQTERELLFVSQDLGLGPQIQDFTTRTGHAPGIDYALLDLDADGEGEVFIRLFDGDACRPGGCTTAVFSQLQGRWIKVLETTEVEVTVTKQMHRGYRDILVASRPWLWTGKVYRSGR